MKNTTYVDVDLNGKNLRFETGLLANQAAGAVSAIFGDNIVFSAVAAAKEPRVGVDFFPLQVEYREKFYAAGRFPGGYFKREARPSEKEILTARVTDRPIRTLFQEGFRNEVQVNNTLLCTDATVDPDFLSINAASAALQLTELPFNGPIAAVRVGIIDGEYILNPTHEEEAVSDLILCYAGTRDKALMIEGSSQEISEAQMVGAMKFGHEYVVKLIDAQIELRKLAGLAPKVFAQKETDAALLNKAREICGEEFSAALTIAGKLERQDTVSEIKVALKEKLLEVCEEMTDEEFFQMFDQLEIELVRSNVLDKGVRIDGRAANELRPLFSDVSLMPRTHGSAIFNRGETSALAVITLGTMTDSQSLDAISGGQTEKNFLLHYNFPPYCVGEVRRLGVTSRREIGHGNLAERSLQPMLPDDYPYSVRVVSEIMGSNGSSSMASICAGTLALLDAGVPMKKPVAGISVGLFCNDSKNVLVTDILGTEDHCGDMDFKVGGTRDGITGFQVDLKIHGLDWDLVEGAFEQARIARLDILDHMAATMAGPREELSAFAPRIHTMKIDPEKIGALIGPGGKHIRGITESTGVQIDVQDDGAVSVFSTDKEGLDAAVAQISGLTAEAEIGHIYRGTVTGIKDFGAFVEILPGKDGLVHISELADFRVGKVEDICQVGDPMWVKCIDVDDRGKIKLSRKAALAEKGEEGAEN